MMDPLFPLFALGFGAAGARASQGSGGNDSRKFHETVDALHSDLHADTEFINRWKRINEATDELRNRYPEHFIKYGEVDEAMDRLPEYLDSRGIEDEIVKELQLEEMKNIENEIEDEDRD